MNTNNLLSLFKLTLDEEDVNNHSPFEIPQVYHQR